MLQAGTTRHWFGHCVNAPHSKEPSADSEVLRARFKVGLGASNFGSTEGKVVGCLLVLIKACIGKPAVVYALLLEPD